MAELLVKYIGSPGHGVSAEEAAEKIAVNYAKPGDAGLDLFCCTRGPTHIAPGHSTLIAAGIAVKIPDPCFGLIKARSSAFTKHGLMVVDGVIDSGYVGPLFINVFNPGLNGGGVPVVIEPYTRLAQLIILPFRQFPRQLVDELPRTDRGASGFGSSGV